MNSQLPKCVLNYLIFLLISAGILTTSIVSAAMNADSDLDFVAAATGGTTQPASGSWFSMAALDLDVDGIPETNLYTPISSLEGIKLGVIQTPSGSHSGAIDGTESPTVDNPWGFFGNTGMHGTVVTAITVAMDDGAGNVTFVMSGWTVDWNGGYIDMGTGTDAVVNCANTCEYGDTYTLDYNAIVPSGSFAGVAYAIHLEGTIAQRPATNTAPVANDDPAAGSISVDRKATGRPYTAPVIDVVVNDADVDGNSDIDRTTVTIQADATNGATNVDAVTGNVTYTPNDDYTGPDSFTYTVSDFGGPEAPNNVLESNVATVSITVQNAVPVAVDDPASVDTATNSSVDIDVTANDTDSDGTVDSTTVSTVTPASNGTTGINPVTGVITYVPTVGFIGQDTFTYTVNDNDGATSNAATVTVTVLNSGLGVLDPAAFLLMVTGVVTDPLIRPPLGQGSWFSMEVQPGQPLHTPIAGFNHLQLGTLQPASSVPLLPNIDQGWSFFGNTGVHQTTTPVTIITDDGAGNVTLGFAGWDVSWNGLASIPLGEGGNPDGIAILTCYTDLALLAQGDCSEGDEFVLEYSAIVPPGDPSGFGGVPYGLHMEGVISLTGSEIGGGCVSDPNDPNDPCPYNVDVASVLDANGLPLIIVPGAKADAAGNTTGFGLKAAEIGVGDPLMNPTNGVQCVGGCADFVITSVTTDYIDVVFKLNIVNPSDGTQMRKLKNNRWTDFDASGGDLIGSAPSVDGKCQGPQGVFSVGIRAGSDCIYMRMFDGGANDADELKNGTVVDPSGILLAGDPNVPPGSTSGCSLSSSEAGLKDRADWLILAGFLFLLLVFRRRYAKA